MMRVLIITGGDCSADVMLPRYDFCIAADSGLDTAKALGIFPDVIIGDFDSVSEPPTEYSDPASGRKSEIITHPAKKDDTDTGLAAVCALERGATEILIVGGIGGRLDHTLSNMALVERLTKQGIPATVTDGDNEIRVLCEGDTARIPFGEYRYFSVFAHSEAEVTLAGCAYPLERGILHRENGYAVSNEPLECGATVECCKGSVTLVRSERLR